MAMAGGRHSCWCSAVACKLRRGGDTGETLRDVNLGAALEWSGVSAVPLSEHWRAGGAEMEWRVGCATQ